MDAKYKIKLSYYDKKARIQNLDWKCADFEEMKQAVNSFINYYRASLCSMCVFRYAETYLLKLDLGDGIINISENAVNLKYIK